MLFWCECPDCNAKCTCNLWIGMNFSWHKLFDLTTHLFLHSPPSSFWMNGWMVFNLSFQKAFSVFKQYLWCQTLFMSDILINLLWSLGSDYVWIKWPDCKCVLSVYFFLNSLRPGVKCLYCWWTGISMIHGSCCWQVTVKPVYNDHLYNKIYCLWFIQ